MQSLSKPDCCSVFFYDVIKVLFSILFTECRTGEVCVTQGHNLSARYVIHTVGPKYNVKYQTAAESTLHICYRLVNSLILEP